MDVHNYPLVPLPAEQRTLVPLSVALVGDADDSGDSHDEFSAFFWRLLCQLALLLWFALLLLHWARRQLVELRLQANFWRAMHQRARQREAVLAQRVQQLQAEIRAWEKRCHGRKSETAAAAKPQPPVNVTGNVAGNDTPASIKPTPRPRGQQRHSKGHGRRNHEHLPTTEETCALPVDQQCCPHCRQPFEEIPGTADGAILEIDVRAYRRRYHRRRYRRTCTCAKQPAVIAAPPPDKLFPKCTIGMSIWVLLLRRKFEFFHPLYRVLAELRSHGLQLPAGTITAGLKKCLPLLQPLYELLVEHNRGEGHWHCDETRWLVFVKHEGKAGFCWNLWVFAAKESIVFVLDPTRAHNVPEDHFGADAAGIVSVDRYSAYKAMAQVKAGQLLLAFCWAHVRRDFLAVLTSWAELTDWAWSWVEDIGLLYQLNDKRLSLLPAPATAAAPGTASIAATASVPATALTVDVLAERATAYAEADRRVRAQVEHLRERRDRELCQANLRQPQKKVLTSLGNHWAGLTVFVDHPEVPMDNNEAERRERGPVVARKNFYGSGALWSGRLTAMLFSLFQTIQLWGMDVGRWLTEYLGACVRAQGKPPPEPQRYLPWNMTEAERARLSLPKTKPPP
jgi:transposase